MRILITGGGGFLGRKLIAALLAGRGDGPEPSTIIALDRVAPAFDDTRVQPLVGELTDPACLAEAFAEGIDRVWHLAAAVSGECEADLDLGLSANLDGTLELLQAARTAETCPRVVFSSSLAIYGGPLPDVVDDDTPVTPDSSYGTQKAIGELLVKDLSRKGFIDGRSLRLPTVSIRPGKPNKAASGFASGILREPLAGQRSRCPVPPETPMAIVSPRQAVDGLLRAGDLPGEAFGPGRVMNQPGFSVTIAEMVAGLERAKGQAAVDLIDWEPDPAVMAIVKTWPKGVASARATAAGLRPDTDIDGIIAAHLEDEVG
ncbi:MAG: D-erythronate dehydrogenase [Pseudomonadota bacterium]